MSDLRKLKQNQQDNWSIGQSTSCLSEVHLGPQISNCQAMVNPLGGQCMFQCLSHRPSFILKDNQILSCSPFLLLHRLHFCDNGTHYKLFHLCAHTPIIFNHFPLTSNAHLVLQKLSPFPPPINNNIYTLLSACTYQALSRGL